MKYRFVIAWNIGFTRTKTFVRLLPDGRFPDTLQVKGTNFCDIGWTVDPGSGRLILMSVIDNLVKGAAGQAVQNMNLMLGFDESARVGERHAAIAISRNAMIDISMLFYTKQNVFISSTSISTSASVKKLRIAVPTLTRQGQCFLLPDERYTETMNVKGDWR
jgi:hypothetical protein